MGRSSARGGRGKGRNSVHTTSPPLSIGGSAPTPVTTPATGVTPAVSVPPDVPVLPAAPVVSVVPTMPATLSTRRGKGKGLSSVHIHIQETTISPPSISFAAPAPVCTLATLVGFTTPSAPAHGSMAHASASATSDPISSSIGEIPVSPGSQPSSSSGTCGSLPQLFVGSGGHMYVTADFCVSHAITRVVKSKFDRPYSKWSITPAEVKNLWFDEFK
ncbi:hypothetical protein Droror1_Dr00025636, partial [Drosera rotundifolia]